MLQMLLFCLVYVSKFYDDIVHIMVGDGKINNWKEMFLAAALKVLEFTNNYTHEQ